MKTREIVHQWAQQNGDSGKCGNVFYEDKTIYSYGYHYKIASFYGDLVLVNSNGYSVSTATHTSYVRQSINNLYIEAPKLYDQNCTTRDRNNAHKENLSHLAELIGDNIRKLATARKKEFYVDSIQKCITDIRLYINRLNVPKSCQNANVRAFYEKGFEVDEETLQAIRDAEKITKTKAEAKARKLAKDWINHNGPLRSSNPVFLRLSIDEQTVETSQSVSVPTDQARLLFAVVKRSAINKTSLNAEQLNGHGKIGYYNIDRIVNGDITAGCHHIKYKEIADFAKRVNW